ncbi:hypothetical protein, partial [Legionella parisiensis]|uniref:hypothetical protein n=1 Tax=Legionella parisiensis TaxID=45071 RepID=UPI00196A1063
YLTFPLSRSSFNQIYSTIGETPGVVFNTATLPASMATIPKRSFPYHPLSLRISIQFLGLNNELY